MLEHAFLCPSCTLFSVSCRIDTPHFSLTIRTRIIFADSSVRTSTVRLGQSRNATPTYRLKLSASVHSVYCVGRREKEENASAGRSCRGDRLRLLPTGHKKTERGGDDVAARGGDHVLWPLAALDSNSSLPRAVAVSGCALSRLSETATKRPSLTFCDRPTCKSVPVRITRIFLFFFICCDKANSKKRRNYHIACGSNVSDRIGSYNHINSQ